MLALRTNRLCKHARKSGFRAAFRHTNVESTLVPHALIRSVSIIARTYSARLLQRATKLHRATPQPLKEDLRGALCAVGWKAKVRLECVEPSIYLLVYASSPTT